MADDPSNPWSNSGWNVTKQGQYHQQHGQARAEARARDAGTTVGGKRPQQGSRQASGAGGGQQKTVLLKHIYNNNGWSPVLAAVADGTRRVHQVVAWVGGSGTPPATGKYIGPLGLVTSIADGEDIRGPAGANGTGGGGGTTDVDAVAHSNLGGHRAVRSVGGGEVDLVDSTNATHAGKVLGVTTGAAALGDPISVRAVGALDEPSFAFTPGPVYFDLNGVLTQTVPTTGFVQQVAVALSATTIVVQIGPPMVLS